jgi:hypothetical protein
MESLLRLFYERVAVAATDWAEANKNAIGEKWSKHIAKYARRALSLSRDPKHAPTVPEVMGFALWAFNMVAGLGVMAGLGPNGVSLQGIPPSMDEKSTRRLLYLCSACLSLQYLR